MANQPNVSGCSIKRQDPNPDRHPQQWYVLRWHPSGGSVIMDTPDSKMVHNKISENTRRKKLGQRAKE
jgi:hypothetical protein